MKWLRISKWLPRMIITKFAALTQRNWYFLDSSPSNKFWHVRDLGLKIGCQHWAIITRNLGAPFGDLLNACRVLWTTGQWKTKSWFRKLAKPPTCKNLSCAILEWSSTMQDPKWTPRQTVWKMVDLRPLTITKIPKLSSAILITSTQSPKPSRKCMISYNNRKISRTPQLTIKR